MNSEKQNTAEVEELYLIKELILSKIKEIDNLSMKIHFFNKYIISERKFDDKIDFYTDSKDQICEQFKSDCRKVKVNN